MQVWLVEEDACVSHWVIAACEERAKEIVRDFAKDSGYEEELGELSCEPFASDAELCIDCEGVKIRHSAKEWLHIYEFKPKYLACSEY